MLSLVPITIVTAVMYVLESPATSVRAPRPNSLDRVRHCILLRLSLPLINQSLGTSLVSGF